MAKQITIILAEQDKRLAIPSLVTVLQDTLGMLKDIDCDITNKQQPSLRWFIKKIEMHSPFMATLEAEPVNKDDATPDVDVRFVQGMRQLQRGASQPKNFPSSTLTRARRIMSLYERGIDYIEYSIDGEKPVRPTRQLADNLDKMMMVAATRPYEEDTELEGRLEDVSLHPSTPRFAIYDPLTDMPIRCEFSTADVDVVAELLKRRARVRVAGMARYNKNHRPMSITVRAITPLPEQKDLPQMKDLRKAKIDITGGASPVDHIRELRDGH